MGLGLVLGIVAGVALVVLARRWRVAGSARDRLGRDAVAADVVLEGDDEEPLRRWLQRAGFREPAAPRRFVTAVVVFAAVALAFLVVVHALDPFAPIERTMQGLPGGFGGLVVSLLHGMPIALAAFIAAAPFLQVRGARRRRVAEVEQDLPTTLELLATLSEAGLGLDAALARIQEGELLERPLAREFALFRAETLAGVPRVRALRRLAQRLDVPPLSAFVSALVQAEQMGIGLADVLRRQADDLRGRRREQALLRAQALPVKLVIPLVLCFLPGIFVFTLGPALYSILRLTAGAIGGGS
ncbi:MAG: type II secretion system F family protein [Planctomycetes bacterium]|nr:type II secretion system F family protein [Planctomycetota bacterium]MCC7173028.1 type II secretion system F family protein [Planctomycetota bacterium]